jgi:hypothetical protein
VGKGIDDPKLYFKINTPRTLRTQNVNNNSLNKTLNKRHIASHMNKFLKKVMKFTKTK